MSTIEITDEMIAGGAEAVERYFGHMVRAKAIARDVICAALAAAPTPTPAAGTKHMSREETVDTRLAALEAGVLANNRLYGLLKGRLDGVEEDLNELTQRFEAHTHEIDIHSTDRPTGTWVDMGDPLEHGPDLVFFPDQPAEPSGHPEVPTVDDLDIHERVADWQERQYRQRPGASLTPQPAADDAEKWEAVRVEMMHTYTSHAWPLDKRSEDLQVATAKATVAKAVELGLVPAIDPESPDQLRVARKAVDHMLNLGNLSSDEGRDKAAKRFLTALAKLNGGER